MEKGGDAGYLSGDLLEGGEEGLYGAGEEYEGLLGGVEVEMLESGGVVGIEEGGDGGGVEVVLRELEDEFSLVELAEEQRGESGDSVGSWIGESLLRRRATVSHCEDCREAQDERGA